MLEASDGETEERIDLAHPECVAPRQVVVDGDDVDALPLQRAEVDGEGGDERLALAGLHLRDLAVVERRAADELHVEVAEADGAPRSLPHDRERFGKEVVEAFAAGDPLSELGGTGGERAVCERGHAVLQPSYSLHHAPIALDLLIVRVAEDVEQFADHRMNGLRCHSTSMTQRCWEGDQGGQGWLHPAPLMGNSGVEQVAGLAPLRSLSFGSARPRPASGVREHQESQEGHAFQSFQRPSGVSSCFKVSRDGSDQCHSPAPCCPLGTLTRVDLTSQSARTRRRVRLEMPSRAA